MCPSINALLVVNEGFSVVDIGSTKESAIYVCSTRMYVFNLASLLVGFLISASLISAFTLWYEYLSKPSP